MTKYIKGKDGKFAGSIGDGKTNVPTAAPKISKAEQRRLENNERIRAINERYAAGREERVLKAQKNEAGRQAWFRISDGLNVSHPTARWMVLDEDFSLVGLKADRDGDVIATASEVMASNPGLVDDLAALKEYDQVSEGRYKTDAGHRVGIFYRCGEDGCQHQYYPEGFQPGHRASNYCRSGQRPHCTCDTCF